MKNKYSPAQMMREREALLAQIAEQKAMIEYLSMMTGVDLDDDEEEDGDEDDEK